MTPDLKTLRSEEPDWRANCTTALAILAAFMKMSDDAEALGGAWSIAGIASLHKMQTSIQKNGPRLAALAAALNPSGVEGEAG